MGKLSGGRDDDTRAFALVAADEPTAAPRAVPPVVFAATFGAVATIGGALGALPAVHALAAVGTVATFGTVTAVPSFAALG
ncbi:MAG: hypothetical protein ACK4YP_23875, partial [Myxococcota bacterium]